MSEPILKIEDLYTHYLTRLNEKVYSVDGVSFTLEKGEILGIAGESGCGKSTLALSLVGLFQPPLHYGDGKIIVDGIDVTKLDKTTLRKDILGRKLAYIPQAAMNALNPTAKVFNVLRDVMKEHDPSLSKEQVYNMAKARFEDVNLPAERVLKSYPNELSGGMKQRTVIAISTFMNPTVLIADEPTSALDVTSQKVVIDMFKDLLKKGYVSSMIFITHELPLLYHIATKIAVMYAGEFVEYGDMKKVIFNPIHPYSKELMGAIIVPQEGMKGKKLASIPGAPPNLKNPPAGCRFAERCKYATEECKNEHPAIMLSSNGDEFRCRLGETKLREMWGYEPAK